MDRQFWAGMALAGFAYEVWALRTARQDHTLSAFTRAVFHTDTQTGRTAFTLAWGGLTAWFAHHILKGA